MAVNEKLVLVNVNMNGNEVRNLVLQNLATDPASGKEGQIYANTTAHKIRFYNGSAWKNVGDIESIGVADGETVLKVDVTDPANPLLSMAISATQGTGVSVTEAVDGLKVSVQDGTTSQKGIVQLFTPTVADDFANESKALTAKGAKVSIETLSTPTAGFLKTYEFKQNGVSLGKVDIPKDFLVKEAKVKESTNYATNTAYAKDDIIVNSSKIYRVNTAITASQNTKFSDVDTVEISGIPAEAGITVMMFVINVKEGSADSEYIYVNFSKLAQTYSADEDGLTKDENNVFSIKNRFDSTVKTDSKVYKFKVNKWGQVEAGDEAALARVATGTIAAGAKTATIVLPAKSTFMGAFASQGGQEVITDVTVTPATQSAAGSVVFSIVENATAAINLTVSYLGYEA